MVHLFFAGILALFWVSNPEWELKKSKSGIEIYTRVVEGSSFNEFKGVTTIRGSNLDEVLKIVLDVPNYCTLFPDCMKSEIVKQEGEYYNVHYIQIKSPWPAKSRDAVYEERATVSKGGKFARINIKPVSGFVDENDDFIRIQEGLGFWEIEELPNGDVHVIYQYWGEPNGTVPAWLTNSFVVSHPFKTLINLQIRVKKQKG